MVSIPTLRLKLRRDLRRRRGQFAAIVVTLFLGIVLFGTSYDAFLNLQSSYDEVFARTHFADVTVAGGDLRAVEAIAERQGALVATRTVADVPLRFGTTTLLGRIVGMPAGSQPPVNGLIVLQGAYLAPGQGDVALVEQHAASHFGLDPGVTVQAHAPAGWRTLTVAGIAASPEYLWPARNRQEVLTTPDEFAVLFVPESLAAEIGGPAARSELSVYVPDRDRAMSVVEEVAAGAERAGATDIVTRADQPSNAALQEDVQGFGELSFLFPLLFLTGAAMAAWILLTRLVQSQRSQIGTLRAFGARRSTLLAHYLGFGLACGVLGGVPGAVVGMLGAHFATGAYTSAISVPITVTPLHWSTALIGVAFGIAIGAVGAAGPALAASRVPPAEAMRGILPAHGGGIGLLERVVPFFGRIPPAGRMAVRGIARDRRRSLYTIAGVILALVLVLVSWGMLDSTQVLLARQFGQVQRQDAQVYLSGPDPTGTVSRVAEVPGVAAAEAAAEVPATIRGPRFSYATSLLALQPTTSMHGFVLDGGGTTTLPSDGILAGSALRSTLGVDVGDRVRVVLPSLGTTIEESVAGFLAEPLGTFAYIALPSLERAVASAGQVPGSVVNTALLRFDPGANPDALRMTISSLPGVTAYVDSRALQRAADGFMALFYAFVGLMLAFGAILAFALVFNAMSVNVAERSTEIATLRSEGVPLGRVGRLVGGENMIVTALGIVPGLLIGYVTAKAFMGSFSSDLFSFDLSVRPTTFVLSALAMLLVGVVSQWPAMRAIGRVDVASALRERTG